MAIDKSAAVIPFATVTGTTLAGTWTRVTCPDWARYATGINNTGGDIAIRFPAVADAAAYAATDDQQIIPNGGSWTVPFSKGGAEADDVVFSVRTPAAINFHFSVGA